MNNKATHVMELRSASGVGGGPDKTILLTPYYLDLERFKIIIVYLRDKDLVNVSMSGRHPSAKYIDIVENSRISYQVFRQLKKIMIDEKVDLIHGHDYKANFWALIFSKILRRPIIATVHLWTDDDWKIRLYTWWDRRLLKYFDHIIAVSQPLQEEILRQGVSREKTTLLANGVDCEFFKRNRHYSTGDGTTETVTIGYVGRLVRIKNLELLLEAFSNLIRQGLHCKLLIAGDGQERIKLISLADHLGIQSSVEWMGYVSDPRDVYERIDIFVLPSSLEGFSNVLLEAMSFGIPCIATSVGGNVNLIEDKISGILVQAGNRMQLEEALSMLIGDSYKRRRLGENARRHVASKCSIEKRFNAYGNILNKVLAKGNI